MDYLSIRSIIRLSTSPLWPLSGSLRSKPHLANRAVWTIVMTIACAVSRTSIQLTIFRALAGAGPAAMVPAALGILASSFPPSRARSTAFATLSGGDPVGVVFGIVFGGVITEYARSVRLLSFIQSKRSFSLS